MAYPIGCYRTYPACMLLAVLLNGGKSWQVGSFLQCVRQDEKERMNQDATVEDQKKRKKLLDERSGVETVSEQEGWRKRSKARQGVEKSCACSDPPAISLMVAGGSHADGSFIERWEELASWIKCSSRGCVGPDVGKRW
jgi:hypothetical protein